MVARRRLRYNIGGFDDPRRGPDSMDDKRN